MTLRGRRAWHVIKVNVVNVGRPNGPLKRVSANKRKSKEVEKKKIIRDSDGS